jgi:2-C-methyl-D-erythritol 4-phosphate cytidylyltransferase
MRNIAIILAGGVGSRVGANVPKQFIEVLGKPVLVYTLEIYQRHPEIDAIEVVCHANYIDYLHSLVDKYHLSKVNWVVNGGETFQESCLNGINYLQNKVDYDDQILIHYGAAPFASSKILSDAIEVGKSKGNAVCGIPCFQLMGTNDGGVSENWVDRDKYVQITCPYCFKYGFVLDLYREAQEKDILGKVEPHVTTLMQYMGYKLNLSCGDQTNIKITTKEDLDLFEGYVLMKQRHLKE